ncbi:transducin-like enhancer protein 2 [Pseudopipra pipra]|uniref:transducin-like enhancer protein 2 n=1 Tax=Pseudopipra pipra TaxID=415032 RepID=UPI003139340C
MCSSPIRQQRIHTSGGQSGKSGMICKPMSCCFLCYPAVPPSPPCPSIWGTALALTASSSSPLCLADMDLLRYSPCCCLAPERAPSRSISCSPLECLQDEEQMGLKRKREEKNLPGHSDSDGDKSDYNLVVDEDPTSEPGSPGCSPSSRLAPVRGEMPSPTCTSSSGSTTPLGPKGQCPVGRRVGSQGWGWKVGPVGQFVSSLLQPKVGTEMPVLRV